MARQTLIYILLSLVIVLFSKYFHLLIVYLDMLYTYVNVHIIPVFNQTPLALFIIKVAILALLPISLAAIPAIGYRLVKGKTIPHFIALTWIIWLIIVLSKVLIH